MSPSMVYDYKRNSLCQRRNTILRRSNETCRQVMGLQEVTRPIIFYSQPEWSFPRLLIQLPGPSRCFPFWQELLACYVVNTNTEDISGGKKCLPVMEDYYECLHHRKEVSYSHPFLNQSILAWERTADHNQLWIP